MPSPIIISLVEAIYGHSEKIVEVRYHYCSLLNCVQGGQQPGGGQGGGHGHALQGPLAYLERTTSSIGGGPPNMANR